MHEDEVETIYFIWQNMLYEDQEKIKKLFFDDPVCFIDMMTRMAEIIKEAINKNQSPKDLAKLFDKDLPKWFKGLSNRRLT